jgi:ubiquinone/menaquinone biosynthesis C-methylase UbiE
MPDSVVTGSFVRGVTAWSNPYAGYLSEAMREAAITRAYLRPEMVIADIGCEGGSMAARLASSMTWVHVIERVSAMLAATRCNLARFANVSFHCADGERLPLADCSMDAVFATMYLHHCRDPQRAIYEMVRVLRPGGRLMIIELGTRSHAGLQRKAVDEVMGFAREQMRMWLRAADLVNILVRSIDGVDTRECSAPVDVILATGSKRITMHQTVRKHYTTAVLDNCGCAEETPSSSSCCGQVSSDCGCCGANIGTPVEGSVQFIVDYSPDELAALPSDVRTVAFGCGNPVALANLRPGEIVLDIGSGSGLDALLAARQVGPSGKVIGVDMTPAMTERATRAAAQAGFDNVEFRHGQAEALPVANASVDVVLSNCVINLCEDKGAVFAEAFRVLKPGGRLEISDMVTAGPLPLALRYDESGWSSCISGALPEQEYLDLVAEAGFEEITSHRSTSAGVIGDVPVYSVTISARKPAS